MSLDNTNLALEDLLNPREECSEPQSAMSENTYLSLLAARCLPQRTVSRPKGSYEVFLTTIFGCPAADVLAHMYAQEQMSIADIHAWLVRNVGWSVCERQVHEIMKRNGVLFRDYADRKRLSWKQGKMDTALAKSREANKQTYFIGSSAEKMVRYLLQVSLTALKLPWHVVIGDQLQIILSRYEVDIPVVVIDPATGLSCRFAVEVDSTFTHGPEAVQSRDRIKDDALNAAGWTVYRVNADSLSPMHIVPQVVDVAIDIKLICGRIMNAKADGSKAEIIPNSALLPERYSRSNASSSLPSARCV